MAPLLAVFVVLAAASAWADEPPSLPTDPPQARVSPPVGVTSQARMQPPGGAPMTLAQMILLWLQGRISIPSG